MRAPGLAIGDALIAWHRPQILLPLVSYDWRKSTVADPVYPAHPRLDCPRIVLRMYTKENEPQPGRGVDFDWALSLFYYRLQIPGEHHQRVLLDELEQIEAPLLGNFVPQPVVMAGADYLASVQTVIHDEIRNPNIDDPNLRISVGEIVITVNSHDNAL